MDGKKDGGNQIMHIQRVDELVNLVRALSFSSALRPPRVEWLPISDIH